MVLNVPSCKDHSVSSFSLQDSSSASLLTFPVAWATLMWICLVMHQKPNVSHNRVQLRCFTAKFVHIQATVTSGIIHILSCMSLQNVFKVNRQARSSSIFYMFSTSFLVIYHVI